MASFIERYGHPSRDVGTVPPISQGVLALEDAPRVVAGVAPRSKAGATAGAVAKSLPAAPAAAALPPPLPPAAPSADEVEDAAADLVVSSMVATAAGKKVPPKGDQAQPQGDATKTAKGKAKGKAKATIKRPAAAAACSDMKRPAAACSGMKRPAAAAAGHADGWSIQTYARGSGTTSHGSVYKMWVAPDGTRYRSKTQAVMAGFAD